MQHVTLLFLRRDTEILLAMKKRGFGVGKWNGVGGKVEEGESYEQAAIRECQEEIGVTPKSLKACGELYFKDLPDVEHYCHIYVTTNWEGTPHETEEMSPHWYAEIEIPYDAMWPDDRLWVPLMLAGKPFKGSITIEDNVVRYQDIKEVDAI
jgi:8-oxo-dGTP diphosphatase